MKRFWQNLLAVFHEIFDEASYARFLRRQGVESSQDAYWAFLEESEDMRTRRPRCC
jgi:hypothetical protein